MGENKSNLPVLVTSQAVVLKINVELVKKKITVESVQKEVAGIEMNEDHLQEMADSLKKLDEIDKTAETVHKITKAPYWDAGKAVDAGKNLVLKMTADIRGPLKAKYDQLLAGIALRRKEAEEKRAAELAILKGIEDNVIDFSNKIVQAVTRKQLTDVESLINLEKSPSRSKKYGDFHQKAIERYDQVLIPIIKDQKVKVEQIEALNKQLEEAEKNNDPEKMDELNEKVDLLSNEILQNQAIVQESALNQAPIESSIAEEVFPDIRTKRTNYSFEIVDVDLAFKKAKNLLEISLNKEAVKIVLNTLKDTGAFDDKDEVVVNGIKYIATKTLAI